MIFHYTTNQIGYQVKTLYILHEYVCRSGTKLRPHNCGL